MPQCIFFSVHIFSPFYKNSYYINILHGECYTRVFCDKIPIETFMLSAHQPEENARTLHNDLWTLSTMQHSYPHILTSAGTQANIAEIKLVVIHVVGNV